TSAQQLNAEAAENHEKNAWQASGAIDGVIVIALLATAVLGIAAAFIRAAGRDVGPPSPSALATIAGLIACALVAYRIFQPPGLNEAAVVKIGAPLSLVVVGALAIFARSAAAAEREASAAVAAAPPDAAQQEPPPEPPAGPAEPAPSA
ncbi:MAG: hypothetical protein ACJ760_09270, partial [Thermoleophilaceae bacterium]